MSEKALYKIKFPVPLGEESSSSAEAEALQEEWRFSDALKSFFTGQNGFSKYQFDALDDKEPYLFAPVPDGVMDMELAEQLVYVFSANASTEFNDFSSRSSDFDLAYRNHFVAVGCGYEQDYYVEVLKGGSRGAIYHLDGNYFPFNPDSATEFLPEGESVASVETDVLLDVLSSDVFAKVADSFDEFVSERLFCCDEDVICFRKDESNELPDSAGRKDLAAYYSRKRFRNFNILAQRVYDGLPMSDRRDFLAEFNEKFPPYFDHDDSFSGAKPAYVSMYERSCRDFGLEHDLSIEIRQNLAFIVSMIAEADVNEYEVEGDVSLFNFSGRKKQQKRVVAAISDPRSFLPVDDERVWFGLLCRMPEELRLVLMMELKVGNKVTSIGCSDWPHAGSVVANVSNRFTVGRKKGRAGVVWRLEDDPHYWREDVSQTVNGVKHLIIT